MKNLNINLNTFSFYKREAVNGKTIKNKCGRDFLYYALAYYKPNHYGKENDAFDIEQKGLFGIKVPSWLAWTQVQFLKVPSFFKKEGLILNINRRKIFSFFDFVKSIIFSRISFEEALLDIRKAVDNGNVSGIDISIGVGGLLDHVMFVYGYDEENLYIFETTKTPIEYESISDEYPQIMKLSKKEIKKRWTRFGRVWEIRK